MARKKGYLFVELQPNVDPKKFVDTIKARLLKDEKDYACTTTGKFHVVVERLLDQMAELDDLVSLIRKDSETGPMIKKTTTSLGLRVES
nr:hypothetical protein [Candidatus Sigynarchaeota archaeon]